MRQKIKVFTSFLAVVLLVFGLASCKKKPVAKITAEDNLQVLVGETKEVTVTVEPADKLKDLEFENSDPTIINVTLTDGKVAVKGLKEGTATITLKIAKTKHVITVLVKPKEVVDVYEAKTILEMLESGKNNDKVSVSGTVYAIATNGFYLEDNTGKIYVNLLESQEVELGDKLTLKGEYGLINNYPRLKAAVIETKDGKATEFGTNVATKTIAEIALFNRENKIGTYANLFEIVGTIVKDAGNIFKIVDEEGKSLLFSDISNLDVLEGKTGGRYRLTVVLHDYNVPQQSWRVSFVGKAEDLVSAPLTLSELMPLVEEKVNEVLPTKVYGLLELPVEHPTIPSLEYEWSVEANEFLTIVDNEATVNVAKFKLEGATEQEVTLSLKVSTGSQQETLTFTVKLMPIVERTVADLLENTPEVTDSYVIVRGTVLALARNQSLSIRSYIIEDAVTKQIITVDFSNTGSYILNDSDKFKSVKVGDEIVVHGQYRNYTRETLQNVTDIEVLSSDNPVVHDFENAYVLNDEASYNEFGLNYESYINKLVKIENPFLNYSTSSTPTQTNWVIINHSEVGSQVYDKSVNKKRFAFLIEAQSENLDNYDWMSMFDISFHGQDALFNETTIYAYALYVSNTYLAFVIPSIDEIVMTLAERVEVLLEASLPKSVNPGTFIELPELKDYVEEGIVWSSSSEVINVETGYVDDVLENTVVTLTATFMDGTEEVNLTFEVTVLPMVTINVSEIFGFAQNGYKLKVEGQVVGFFSDGNASGVRGLVIKDLVTSDVVYVNDPSDKLGTYANYFDINDDLLEIGDIVEIEGIFTITDVAPIRREFVVNDDTIIEIKEKDQEINFPEENMVVISSQAEMVAFFENPQVGVVIKFVGTEENPFAFGGSTNNPIATMNHKFFYNISAKENNDVKYPNNGGKVVSFKNEHNRPNGGEYWWTDLFDLPENSFIGPTATNPPIIRTGVFYAVFAGETGTYLQMDLINVENMSVIPIERRVEIVLGRELKLSVDAGGTLVLPKLEDIVDGGIVWTSEDPLIDPETGQVAVITEEALVTITANFLGKTLDFVITILPADWEEANKKSVDFLLGDGIIDETYFVEAQVLSAGYSNSGSVSEVYVQDLTSGRIIILKGVEANYNEEIKGNDIIRFFGELKNLVSANEINKVYLQYVSDLSVHSSNNASVDYKQHVVTIANHEEMLEKLSVENLVYGQVYYFTGGWYFNNTASAYPGAGENINVRFHLNGSATKASDITFGTKNVVISSLGNKANLGNDWLEEILGITASNYYGTKYPGVAVEGGFYAVLKNASNSYYYFSVISVNDFVK